MPDMQSSSQADKEFGAQVSKPSASGRRRNTVYVPGHGWTYIPDGKYHRHNLGGGNALKAVSRIRRAAAGRVLGHPVGSLRAERGALLKLLAVANQLEEKEAA